jgi:hypothetical protein
MCPEWTLIFMASPRGFAGHITRIELPCEGWLKAA